MPEDRQATLDGLLSMVLEEHSIQSVVWSLERLARREGANQGISGHDRFNWQMAERILTEAYNRLNGQHCGEGRVRPTARSGG